MCDGGAGDAAGNADAESAEETLEASVRPAASSWDLASCERRGSVVGATHLGRAAKEGRG
jgi:hypothetical protein